MKDRITRGQSIPVKKWVQVKADKETQAAKAKLIKAGFNISALVRAYLIAKAKEV